MRVSGAGSARQAHTVGGTSHPAFHAGIDAAGVLRAAHDEAALLEEFGLKVGDQALSWNRIVCSLCQLRGGRGVDVCRPSVHSRDCFSPVARWWSRATSWGSISTAASQTGFRAKLVSGAHALVLPALRGR